MDLVKSRQRVIDHGEVFTPEWIVEAMLDLVKDESERIDSRFLEPACGDGNFLAKVLRRKIEAAKSRFGSSAFEFQHHALLGLMCIYGIELLNDNVLICRGRMLEIFAEELKLGAGDPILSAAQKVLETNILHGDALSMKWVGDREGALVISEWAYLGKGLFQRRDFRFDELTHMSTFPSGSLFGTPETHPGFTPVKDYPRMSIIEITNV